MYRLFDSRLSGNSWKVRILLRQLDLPFERVTLDLAKGESKTPEFLTKSRFARVPVLELQDGRVIVESDAILVFLAQGSVFLPDDPVAEADALSWLFFEQADLNRNLAMPRFFSMRGLAEEKAADIAAFQKQGYIGLQRLDDCLKGRRFLVADTYSVADLGVYPYVAMANEGGYDLERFPNVRAWTARVEGQPGWEPLVPELAATGQGLSQ